MKRILLIAALALSGLFATAQEQLNIVLNDSTYVTYLFSEKPQVTIQGTTLVVQTDRFNVQFPMAQVRRFQFGPMPDDITAINEIKKRDSGMRDNGQSLTVNGQSPIDIYTLDGQLLRSGRSVPYSDLPAGIYIIRYCNASHKLIIK
ncbi:MAG: hypothetical protein Q4E49_06615 [Bacteroidales bacterium]|nr:hypothetical protein [Bacteroidales bacterium]